MKQENVVSREAGLHRGLTKRQLTMIGIGGAIGTGLFMGSGIAIGYAGPGVLLSYLIAATIAVIMMFSLSEMAVAHPTVGSFGTYAELYLNKWSGFIVRYTYWAAQVIAIGSEAVAVGHYMNYWYPNLPVWYSVAGFGVAILYINSRSVASFGSLEYWFSTIKVAAICAFILFGLAQVSGVTGHAVGFGNITNASGGFLPHGLSGVWMAVLMAIFSFYGIEIIAVTAGEAQDPETAVPRAMRTMILRLFLFYVLALAVILAIAPWSQAGAKVVSESPFVKVFSGFGLSYAAGLMNFVVITAALSSMNTNLYLTSRMMFSLSRAGDAPTALGKLSSKGSPVNATLASSVGVLVAAVTSVFSPIAYNYLLGVALGGGILVWLIILVSHLSFRDHWKKSGGRELPIRSPFFPYAQYLGIALLVAILITMGMDREFWSVGIISGSIWVAILTVIYLVRKRKRTEPASQTI